MTNQATDTYAWIGGSGDLWNSGTNWADVTTSANPAGSQPGDQTPVEITGPTGSTYEVIAGGGSAASIDQTGLVDLLGTYALGGVLSVGTPETPVVTTATPGSLSLGTGSAVSAAAIAVNSGTVALAGGASLADAGSLTVGLPFGFVQPSGIYYAFQIGAVGLVSVGAGSSLTAGSLAVVDGALDISGTNASATLGSLSLGDAATIGIATPLGWSTPDNYGTFGDLRVGAGATVTVSGDVTEPDGAIIVSGSGAALSVAGGLTLQATSLSNGFALEASDGGSVQSGELAFQQFGANSKTGSLSVDATSAVEIGTAGNAAVGALTIDAAATATASMSTAITAPQIIDNGLIAAAGGTLTLNGSVSGSGTLLVGAGALLQLDGAVSTADTVDLAATGAGLEIGALSVYSGTAHTYSLYPMAATIDGFAQGDSLTFDNVVATGVTYIATGNGIGTLALLDGITPVAAVSLAGTYAGDTFGLSPTNAGAETVNLLHDISDLGSPLSTTTDTYAWIGGSEDLWDSGTNWADVTTSTSPAGSQPGDQTAVTIAGPTGSTYEVIAGGGTAASIVQTGLVNLLGTYALGGVLSVGTPETPSVTTAVPGSLSLGTGSAVSVAAIAVNSGTITLAGGASLTDAGSLTVGLPFGFVQPSGSYYVFEIGAVGLVSVGTGASLTAGSLAVVDGALNVTGASATLGSLSLGDAATTGIATPLGWSTPDNYGTFGDLRVGAGATVTVSGDVIEPDGAITVTDSGALLSVAGGLTLQATSPSVGFALEAADGGSVQAAGLSFQQFGTTPATGSLSVDATSAVEIGAAGTTTAGALTIDAGATATASISTTITAPQIIENGLIAAAGGTLTLNGSVSGSGTLLVGAGALLQLDGTVSAADTIDLTGTGAELEIGALSIYSGTAHTYMLYPMAATINGFAQGDSLTFDNIVATGVTYIATGNGIGTLALLDGITTVAAVTLAGTYAGDTFGLGLTNTGETVGIVSLAAPPRTLVWTAGTDTSFANPNNWNDTTNGRSPAVTAPGPNDTALFVNAGAVITGTGSVAALSFAGNGVWHLTSAATLTATDNVTVGSSQAAELLINHLGDIVASGAAVIAAGSGSDGSSVSVTGIGSGFQVGGALTVGAAAAGALSIYTGGTVTAASLDTALAAGSSGVVSVSGTDAALITTGSVAIGGVDSGELSVLNGANVDVGGDLDIGQIAGGAGNVDVQGNSTLIVGGNLNFGAGGPAELTVGPDATFQLDNGILNGSPGNATLTLFTTIDPLASNGVTQNLKTSGTQVYAASVANSPFNLSSGISYTLDTPIIEGTAAFTLGASDTTLVLNADTVSAGTTIAFTDGTGRLVIGSDTLGTIDVANGNSFTAEANPNQGMPLIGGFAGIIGGFVTGDTIVVDTTVAATFSQTGSIVSVLSNSGTLGTLRFDSTAAATAATASGLVDQVLCFLPDTMIATPSGEIAVQRLAAGDLVLTAGGAVRPVAWVGEGRVLATKGRRTAATPVIVRKGALAPNVPHTDLHVTKGHALLLDDVLIPVEFLVNHRSILWDDRAREISLYHVELDIHDVLVANGAPAESYRDDGNRWLFRNANSGWGLPAKTPWAPVLTGGPVVDAVWKRLLERSGPRPGVPLTDDPDMHLLVDGARIDGARSAGRVVFRLPSVPSAVRLMSRAASPAELGLARDPRVLGLAVRRIEAWQGARVAVIEAADPRLTDGFHEYEADGAIRWTNGNAFVPSELFDGFHGHLEVVVHFGGTTRYAATDQAEAA